MNLMQQADDISMNSVMQLMEPLWESMFMPLI